MLRATSGLANGGTFNNPTFTGVATIADGSAAAPSLGFKSNTNTGLFNSGGFLGLSVTGVFCALLQGSGGWVLRSDSQYGWAPATNPAAGADTVLSRGAAGVIKFGSAGSFSANGTVATSMTSLGPTGAHTTIQEWLTIQNSSGTTRYIPCY